MGTAVLLLCVFVGHVFNVQSVTTEQDVAFLLDYAGFFVNPIASTFNTNYDFVPHDTFYSSGRPKTPDIQVLAELPAMVNVPRIQVFCDESMLTLLVDKRSNGVRTEEEIQLGDGCYSNRELPNQFVFIYSLDQCGTTQVVENGIKMFTNSLHLNPKNSLPAWWQTLSTVELFCIPKRSFNKPNVFVTPTLPDNKHFIMETMNSSWTGAAESNVYKRGQVVNLQISAKTRPNQWLFIQSCFISAFPEPQTKPRDAVVMNKGCTALMGSSHAAVQFVASDRPDVVNLVLNTFYQSERYIHCNVFISDQGVTFGSKSCNYNPIPSRWEELSGDVEVCKCCRSKCKGPSVKHLTEDAKAVVSTGPLVFVAKDVEVSPEPQETTTSSSVIDSMQSDASHTADQTYRPKTQSPSTSASQSRFTSLQQGVVTESWDSPARLTLLLSGQVQDTEHRNAGSQSDNSLAVQFHPNDLELQPLTTDLDFPSPLANKIQDQYVNELKGDPFMWDLNLLTKVDGWHIPPPPDPVFIAAEFPRSRIGQSGMFGTEVSQVNTLMSAKTEKHFDQNNVVKVRGELAQMQADAAVTPQKDTNDVQPIIRSKLQFSKGADGSQTLSYEEEVLKRKCATGRCGLDWFKSKKEPEPKQLYSTFLNLLRRMDKAE